MKSEERRSCLLSLIILEDEGMPSQVFYEVRDFFQFSWDFDALWAVRLALSTSDAVISLPHFGHGTVEPDEVLPASFPVFLLEILHREASLVFTFVVMDKDTRNVYAVGARHAILTVVTWDILHPYDFLCHPIKELIFLLCEWL